MRVLYLSLSTYHSVYHKVALCLSVYVGRFLLLFFDVILKFLQKKKKKLVIKLS